MTGYKSKRAMAQDKITDEQGRPMTYWGGKAQPAQEQLMSDQINYGMSVTQGGRRIDPMSIYKEPEQEPVAVVAVNQSGGIRMEYQDGSAFDISKHVGQRFYTTPPQRSWVELEGEEIRNLWEEATKQDRSTVTMVTSFARAIEAKLKEKNNG